MRIRLSHLARIAETLACRFVCSALLLLALATTQAAETEMLTNGQMEAPFVKAA